MSIFEVLVCEPSFSFDYFCVFSGYVVHKFMIVWNLEVLAFLIVD